MAEPDLNTARSALYAAEMEMLSTLSFGKFFGERS
jgi:hypothetical protein